MRMNFLLPPIRCPWARFPACGHQVSLLESVAFDRDLSDQVRARVLEELAAINARINEARWPGQARASWGLLQGLTLTCSPGFLPRDDPGKIYDVM